MFFFASAARGTEWVLAEELRELGFNGVRPRSGGVQFDGAREDGWRVCLESRIAQGVRLPVAEFEAASADDLYNAARAVPWETWLTPELAFAVSAHVQDTAVNHSGFAGLRVKDAVADRLRDRFGSRPDVNRAAPDVAIFLLWSHTRATLYLELAGEPLFKRGWRTATGAAPLKETLAAAILRFSGWDRRRPLLDPMCGSGTLAIEAALWAAGTAPGIFRERFGFERWADFTDEDRRSLRDLRGELRRHARGQTPRITASDIDPGVLEAAKTNARAAGVRISIREADVRELLTCEPAPLLVTNPPYGFRIGAADIDTLQQELGATLSRLHGWRAALLAGNPGLERAIPVRPVAKFDLSNGDIPCQLLIYDLP